MFGSFQELGVLERVDRGYSWVHRGGLCQRCLFMEAPIFRFHGGVGLCVFRS